MMFAAARVRIIAFTRDGGTCARECQTRARRAPAPRSGAPATDASHPIVDSASAGADGVTGGDERTRRPGKGVADAARRPVRALCRERAAAAAGDGSPAAAEVDVRCAQSAAPEAWACSDAARSAAVTSASDATTRSSAESLPGGAPRSRGR